MESECRVLWQSAGGKVPEHWDFFKIEDLLEHSKSISVGVMYPGKHTLGGVPLVRVGNVKEGEITSQPDYCIAQEVDEEYRRTRLNGTELLITLVGNPGDCVVVNEQMEGWNVARALAVVRLANPSLREWLRYVLLSRPAKHLIDVRLNTTVQRTLNLKDIKELGVPVPPEQERNKLTDIIVQIERRQILNRRMNETLEAMAQALFKSWFVDFDPVIDNALASGKEIPAEFSDRAAARAALGDKRRPLPAEIRTLFPADFIDNTELGWIPKGWEVSSVGKEFDVTMGQSPPGSTYNEDGEGIAFFQGRADFGFRYPSDRVFCTAPKRFANKGDTLVCVRAPVGDVNMAHGDCCIGRGLSAVRHKSASRSYTYYAMRELREHFNKFEAEGTVFGSINQKDFKALLNLKIDKRLLEFFEVQAGALDTKIEKNSLAILNLTNLRDTLLPKLLSGELRIPEVQKMVEELPL